MILYIKHIDIEGPETIDPFFKRNGFKSQTIEIYNSDPFPIDFDEIEAVICLGGPMNVYEEDKYPFLRGENIFIQKVLKKQIPYLGICLGAQLLAKAVGGKVTRSPVEEIGWRTVSLTSDGQKDPLFQGLTKDFFVYQWHGDMFEVPKGGWLLVGGRECPNQALKVGKNAYGIQFHIEITDKSIREWADEYFSAKPELLKTKKTEMLQQYQKNRGLFEKEAQVIYNNFLKVIKNSQ